MDSRLVAWHRSTKRKWRLQWLPEQVQPGSWSRLSAVRRAFLCFFFCVLGTLSGLRLRDKRPPLSCAHVGARVVCAAVREILRRAWRVACALEKGNRV